MNLDVKQLFVDICGPEVIFSDNGNFTAERINEVLMQFETLLNESDLPAKTQRKIYHITVELLQNFFHHADGISGELLEKVGLKYGFLIVKHVENGIRITGGNYVSEKAKEILQARIDKINSLSNEDLKLYYMEVLNNQQMSAKGGGGLGLIDIAKKSGNKLGYEFYPAEDNYYFYRLDILI